MRSRTTNILQVIILVNGVIFIIIGLFFYFSPLTVLKLFAENVSDNWLDLVRDNELVAPLYNISSGLAALLFTSGFAMVLPLFDPLRYRGLIYFNGIIFPFFASLLFLKNGIPFVFMSEQPGEEVHGSLVELIRAHGGHLIVVILGIIFAFVFFTTLAGIIMTKKQADQGIE